MPVLVLRRDSAGTPKGSPVAGLSAWAKRAAAVTGVRQAEVSLLLTSDEEMAALNWRYRRQNRTTDVLSFNYGDAWRHDPRAALGDVVISLPQAVRQARAARHPLARELRWLFLHGLLHLIGFDHERDFGEMEAVERALRIQLDA